MTEEAVSIEELVQLCAVDGNLYAQTFFPNTARQKSPNFHNDMDTLLENPANRFVGFMVFRDGAKTTKLRLFCSKRIAYGISHTILFVGKSQDHAIKSLHWLKRAVEYNKKWAGTFDLRKGDKWTDTEIEIIHGTDEYPIRVIAMGITGSIRGINVDDYRPDLIILDDPCDEENTATPEARQKMEDLVFGALAHGLAPASEAPDATMAIAQTPLDEADLIHICMKDPQWATMRISCFLENGESSWPARRSTEELNKDKDAHIFRNQLNLWLREMECVVVTSENAAFKTSWLRYWDELPEGGITYLSVDPTPPPKEGVNALKVVNTKLDDAVIKVIKYYDSKVFVADYWFAKSPDPEELVNEFFRLALMWRPMLCGVETTLFQRMLAWYIEKEMLRRRQFFTIIPVEDKRKKSTRIVQTVTRYAANGLLYVHKSQTELIDQYTRYRDGIQQQPDDFLDALTIGMDLINPALEGVVIEGDYTVLEDESNIPELEYWQGAP